MAVPPELPAAATTTAPRSWAYAMAAAKAALGFESADTNERLMTSAPRSVAHWMAEMMVDSAPSLPISTRTSSICTFHATPATATLLSVAAPITPATCVPWSLLPGIAGERPHPTWRLTRPARSVWPSSTPESNTATSTEPSPVVTSQAASLSMLE